MSDQDARRFEERRLHMRYVCTSGAKCELALRSGPHTFEVENISGGGIRIKSSDVAVLESFQEDASVRIISGGDGDQALPVEDLTGRVVWAYTDDAFVYVGIEFDEPLQSKLDFLLGVFFGSGQTPN